ATYGVYDRNLGAPTGADLSHFDVVSWQIGFSFPTLVNADRAAIGAYLDGGGKLFISGQDLGWDSWDQGGSAITWYRQYLHTNYLIDDTNRNTLTGKVNDPIGDGVTLNLLGGDGANNNEYPDAIVPYDQWASPILFYDNSNYTAGIKAITPVHRVVYLGFGYEGINNADDRRLLMGRILDWFHDTIDAPEPALSSVPMVRAFPNPAAGAATLSFAIPKSGKADLQIFAPDGSLIRTLARGQQPAGLHSIKWDGRDNAGRPVASGVYFYRLTTDEFKPSGRLILTR
ncbi:MAG: T9SS type A sorting domain-containing protein, partial [Candidatus Eisenbacteria bacterium]|nr:T9SS type A sorting domain-containing protein [Candidatus Eisenbacteria bacterium]